MIRYALTCEHEHPFEAWFGSSSDYDDQAARGLVECPWCASKAVRKQIMAPSVAGTKRKGAPDGPSPQMHAMMMEAAGKMRKHVEDNFENVGDRFAREARDIHDGVSEERGIYGQATPTEVKDLLANGVKVAPLPAAVTPTPKAKLN